MWLNIARTGTVATVRLKQILRGLRVDRIKFCGVGILDNWKIIAAFQIENKLNQQQHLATLPPITVFV